MIILGMIIGSFAGMQYSTFVNAATPQEVINQWRSLSPNEPYICWQKGSPWNNLDKLQSPPAGVKALQKISVDIGRNEYESTSFVLTNLSDKPMNFEITHDSNGISTTLRKAVWVTVDDGSEVNDALSLIDDGLIVIPSSESREIWITLHGNQVEPGRYNQTIDILPRNLESRAVDIEVVVHDLSLPERLPLAVQFFDEIVATWPAMTPELVEAYMKDLKSHYVNHAYVHPDPLPRLAVDANGQLVTDYNDFDKALDGYKTLAPKRFIFFWASESFLEPSGDWSYDHPESKGRPEFMTPEWKNLFREWLTGWVAHMKDRGIGYDGFVMHPYDERGGPEVQAMIKLIKEVDPNILVLFNGGLGRTVEELEKNIAPYVDVWLPYLYHYLDAGGVNGCISQTVSLDPNTAYTLRFYGKNGGASIYYELVFDGSTARHAQMLDAADWRQATHSFTTASNTTQVRIGFYPTIGNKTILIDDVVLSSGSNLVVNGDMEAGRLSASWPTTSATVVANTTNPHSGRRCAEVKNIPRPPGPAKKAAKRLLTTSGGKLFWTYANPIGVGPTKASPYSAYRVPVWRAWKESMNGFSNWKYGAGRWDSKEKGPNWGMVYLSDAAGCPAEVSKQENVLTSKRWEATREGVEDYAYLYMLREAVREAEKRGAGKQVRDDARIILLETPRKVLADDMNTALADAAKEDIIKAIVSLSVKKNKQ